MQAKLEAGQEATRYHKIAHNPSAVESLFVTAFLEAHRVRPLGNRPANLTCLPGVGEDGMPGTNGRPQPGNHA
jgi:hypothetical protein